MALYWFPLGTGGIWHILLYHTAQLHSNKTMAWQKFYHDALNFFFSHLHTMSRPDLPHRGGL
jgi:hypothetical protein